MRPFSTQLARRALPSTRAPRRPPCSHADRTCSARRRSPRPRARSRPPRPRPVQGLPSRISPPPTPVPQNTPSSESYEPAGAELELGVGRDLHVVADPHLAAERAVRASPPAGTRLPSPGRLRALVTVPAVDRARASRPRRPPAPPARARRPWRRRAARPPSPPPRRPGRRWSASGAEPSRARCGPRRRSPPGSSCRRGRSRRARPSGGSSQSRVKRARRRSGALARVSSLSRCRLGPLGVLDRRRAGLDGDLRRGQRADARDQLVPLGAAQIAGARARRTCGALPAPADARGLGRGGAQRQVRRRPGGSRRECGSSVRPSPACSVHPDTASG